METTFTLIEKITSFGVSGYSFINIPNTYTNLYLMASIRTDYSGSTNGGINDLVIRFNNDSNASYSYRVMYGQGSTTGAFGSTSAYSIHFGNCPSSNSPSGTYCSSELYIPNYSISGYNKICNINTLRQTDTTSGDSRCISATWINTNIINRIDLLVDYPSSSSLIVSGSSAYLYGIKKE